jgi:hypothetical protein
VDRVKRDLGVIRARLHAEIPARAFRVKVLALKRRERLQVRRPQVRKAEPVGAIRAEQARTHADRDCQSRRFQADRLPRIDRRLVRGLGDRLVRLPGGQPRGGGGPLFKNVPQIIGRVARDVERCEVQVVLRRSGDPRLVETIEVLYRGR